MEEYVQQQEYYRIAGVDEAGRGSLAGPVVAAACILPDRFALPGINDSKQLTHKQRECFYQKLTNNCKVIWAVGIVGADVIDKKNILQATLQAMHEAIAQLSSCPDYVLVDGKFIPPGLPMPSKAIIKGDSLSPPIMAASIIAKCTRDGLMITYSRNWPQYKLDQNKGYPTEEHRCILQSEGPSPIHRLTFSSVRETLR